MEQARKSYLLNREAAKKATSPRSRSREIKRTSRTPFPAFPKATRRQLRRIQARMRLARRQRRWKQWALTLVIAPALIAGLLYLLKTLFFTP